MLKRLSSRRGLIEMSNYSLEHNSSQEQTLDYQQTEKFNEKEATEKKEKIKLEKGGLTVLFALNSMNKQMRS